MKRPQLKDPVEVKLKGVPVSEGVAIGTLFFLQPTIKKPIEVPIKPKDVDKEIKRYRLALSSSKEDLQVLQSSLVKEGSEEAVTIIDTHIQMLEDPFITSEMEDRIRDMLKNTETVFHSAIAEYEMQFAKVEDNFFKQRLTDVKDLSNRILKHLNPVDNSVYANCPTSSVVFAKELTPSDTAEASYDKIQAFIAEVGGKTSHAGLIARAKGIPFVANIEEDMLKNLNDFPVIVDGSEGVVILNPSEETIAEYENRICSHKNRYDVITQNVHMPSTTSDDHTIQVFANIENVKDIEDVQKYQCPAVGLVRSEFFFVHEDISKVSEETQFRRYSELIEKTENMPIYFRLFDIGGDKKLSSEIEEELNPALGCRSIRFLLKNPHLLERQLRAILRASQGKNIKLLIPLVTDAQEVLEVKRIAYEIAKELKIPELCEIGAMIEVPSSVVMSDVIGMACDFLSVGTNDLIQYTLAADRTNPSVSNIYHATHPSIVRMLKTLIDVSNMLQFPISICGEMASNPIYVPLLIGLGFKTLSCAPRYIPVIKHAIRQISKKSAEELVKKIMQSQSFEEIQTMLHDYYMKYNQEA